MTNSGSGLAPNSPALAVASAGVGAVAWCAALPVLQPGWAEALVLLAPLVLVPLGLGLVIRAHPVQPFPWTGRVAGLLQLPAAVVLIFSFAIEPGVAAASLAGPWLVVTFLSAGLGLQRLWSRVPAGPGCRYVDVGLLYLAIGGGWVFLSRAGVQPLGFQEPIVLLTGAHFHYAGFLLPLLMGLAVRELQTSRTHWTARAVLVGVPLTALGISLSPFGVRIVEWLASWWMAAAGLAVVVVQWQLARRAYPPLTRGLFAISGLSLAVAMLLAATYALGTYFGRDWLTIPNMLPWHGAVNALGFALPGVLAWWSIPSSARTQAPAALEGLRGVLLKPESPACGIVPVPG